MIKKLFRRLFRISPTAPFDRMLSKLAKKEKAEKKRVLLGWNRGLGDIALGLYAMVQKLRASVPDVDITFLIRDNLQEGFSLLSDVKTIVASEWKRGQPHDVKETLKTLDIDPEEYDLIIEHPNPTRWVSDQLGKVVPKLEWREEYDALADRFGLEKGITYIAAQISAETAYGQWRNWPSERWRELVDLFDPNEKLVLFGFGDQPELKHPQVIDLRGQTSLFEMMALIKNKCDHLIAPDSGVLSMIYYLNTPFPIQVISLWADPRHGILKQNVHSPNPLLVHEPIIAKARDLSLVSARPVYEKLLPSKRPFQPFQSVIKLDSVRPVKEIKGVGCVILAGGQGTRLGFSSPKGMFSIGEKTLFERLVAKVSDSTPFAIMTSPANHEETMRYFASHQNFGKKIFFFQQSTLPLLDEKKRPIGIDGPDGNGSFYRRFVESGVCQEFRRLGVHTISIAPVDNPLALLLDETIFELHQSSQADITLRTIERNSPKEMMGVLVERNGSLEVLEYVDAPSSLMEKVDERGQILYAYAYTGMLMMKLDFVSFAASLDLPLHWVQKTTLHQGKKVLIWKGEKFLFDAFRSASKAAVLCSPRHTCYAPLKTKDGPQGIAAVEQALCQ